MIASIKQKLRIIALPLFKDNYSYIILGTAPNKAVLVDPANPSVVLSFLQNHLPHYIVDHLLYTHKHWDHAGGSEQLISELKQNSKSLVVIAGAEDAASVSGANTLIQCDQEVSINEARMKVYLAPCHTKGHVLYHFLPKNHNKDHEYTFPSLTGTLSSEGKKVHQFDSEECIFTGDTLFMGGVGRFFEGNSQHMLKNLNKISEIGDQVEIFNGHEYTRENLEWSVKVEHDNNNIKEWLEKARNAECTLPSSVGLEKRINVFMRALNPPKILADSISSNPESLLAELREMKNSKKTLIE